MKNIEERWTIYFSILFRILSRMSLIDIGWKFKKSITRITRSLFQLQVEDEFITHFREVIIIKEWHLLDEFVFDYHQLPHNKLSTISHDPILWHYYGLNDYKQTKTIREDREDLSYLVKASRKSLGTRGIHSRPSGRTRKFAINCRASLDDFQRSFLINV